MQNLSTLRDLSGGRNIRVFSMKAFHLFLRVLHTFGWLPSIRVLHVAFPFIKIPKIIHRFIPISHLSPRRNDLAFHSFYFRLQIPLHLFGIWYPLFAIWSVLGSVGFQQQNMKQRINLPSWQYFQLVCPTSFLL